MKKKKVLLSVLLTCVVLMSPLLFVPGVNADTRSDLVEEQKRKQQEIAQVRQELAGVDSNLRDAYIKVLEVEGKIATAQVELQEAQDALAAARREADLVEAQLVAARGEIKKIEADIAENNKRIADMKDFLGEVARAQYRGDTSPSTFDLFVGSASVEDFMEAFSVSQTIERTQTNALAEVEQAIAKNKTRQARQVDVEKRIVELKKEADALVVQCAEKEQAASQKKAELDVLRNQLSQRAREFEVHSASLQGQISQKQAESAQLQAEIAAIDAGNRSSGANVVRDGRFIMPMVPGQTYVTSNFGYRWHPVRGGWRLHSGVDFGVGCGVAQYAPANATVAKISYDSSRGNYIIFNLGMINGHSWQVWTLHLQTGSIAVHVGQNVSQGQFVARTGATGGVTGCHVHQEVRIDGVAKNPLDYIIR